MTTLTTERTSYPYLFFIEEKHSLELLNKEIITAYDFATEKHIPTLGDVAEFMVEWFLPVLFDRAVHRGDVSDGSDVTSFQQSAIRSIEDGTDDEFRMMMEEVLSNSGGIRYDDGDLGEDFITDIRTMLIRNNLFFFNTSETTDELNSDFHFAEDGHPNYANHLEVLCTTNIPICEVW